MIVSPLTGEIEPADPIPLEEQTADVLRVLTKLREENAAVATLLGSGELDVELRRSYDAHGDPALYVDVYLPDDKPEGAITGEALSPIGMTIFDTIYDRCRERWPYIGFSNRTQEAEMAAAADEDYPY